MKTLVIQFWNDPRVCLAAITAIGTAGVAVAGVLDAGGSTYLAVSAGLGALGLGGGASHVVGAAYSRK